MFCCLRANTPLLSVRALPDSSEEDTATFLLKGLVIGQTSVSAVVIDNNGRKITAAPQQIEVSHHLQLYEWFSPSLMCVDYIACVCLLSLQQILLSGVHNPVMDLLLTGSGCQIKRC